MPKPLTYKNQIKLLINGGPKCLLQRPALATHIATIAHMWVHIDCLLGILLAVLTGTEAHTSMMIYTAIVNNGAKTDVLNKLAKPKLSPESFKQFAKLIKEYRNLSAARNKVVHSLWAISDKTPEEIYLINPIMHLDFIAAWAENSLQKAHKSDDYMMIYNENGFSINTSKNI